MKKALLALTVTAGVLSVVSALCLVFLYIDGAVDWTQKIKSLFSIKSLFTKKAIKS